MKPLKIDLWLPIPGKRALGLARSMTAGSHGKAAAKAKAALGTIVANRYTYHRDTARAGFARVHNRKCRDGLSCRCPLVSPDVEIVPSVGELGWCP